MTTPGTDTDRRPLVAAARRTTPARSLAGAGLTAVIMLVTVTHSTLSGVDVWSALLGLGAVLTTVGTALSSVTKVVQEGERDVTPITSPRGPDGEPLVPRTVAILDEILDRLTQAGTPNPPPAAASPAPLLTAPAAPATIAPPGYGGYHRDDLIGVDEQRAAAARVRPASSQPLPGRHRADGT